MFKCCKTLNHALLYKYHSLSSSFSRAFVLPSSGGFTYIEILHSHLFLRLKFQIRRYISIFLLVFLKFELCPQPFTYFQMIVKQSKTKDFFIISHSFILCYSYIVSISCFVFITLLLFVFFSLFFFLLPYNNIYKTFFLLSRSLTQAEIIENIISDRFLPNSNSALLNLTSASPFTFSVCVFLCVCV